MKNFNEIKKELEKFGLSKNEAEIYLLLVTHKELRIQEVVQLSKVPRSTVYNCLKRLFELGIAEEIVNDNFKKIRPYSVGMMRHGLDERITHLKKLSADLDHLEKTISLASSNDLNNSMMVRYYKDRSGARQIFWNSLNAENTTYVYSDWGRGRYIGIKFYESFVEEWRMRKLKEKVIINLTPDSLKSIKQHTYPGSPISRTNVEDIRTLSKEIIPIKGDTLIYDNIYAQIYLKNVEINGFEIESTRFVATQRSIFEILWNMAKPVSLFF